MMDVFVLSFSFAAVAFSAFSALLAIHLRRNWAVGWLLSASLVTVIWAAAIIVLTVRQGDLARWAPVLDVGRNGAWLLFLAALLPRGGTNLLRLICLAIPPAGIATLGFQAIWPQSAGPLKDAPVLVMLLTALLGLLAIEQLYRNAARGERRVIGLLSLGLGGVFVFDLFVFSHALLLLSLDADLWSARGFVIALLSPLLVIGARRHRDLGQELYVSREMVFYAATLVAAGLYFMAMALVGYTINVRGGEWGRTLQAAFFIAALVLLVAVLFSVKLRSRLRVFVSKHFFRGRYDYRQEWLRLIATLADDNGGSAPERALRALARILESASGELWLREPGARDYVMTTALSETEGPVYAAEHPLPLFLHETNWIVDTRDYRESPETYGHAFRGVDDSMLAGHSVIVPVRHHDDLLGFARLDRPAAGRRLNYEDHDLLKTVGRQMGVFIAQERARDQLAQTRQFEAFNRMTAFLMHDLKNLMAQQALIVQNAPRLKHRPEFVDDAFRTVERSVQRMRKLLDQLQQGGTPSDQTRINLTPPLEEAVADAASRSPVPRLQIDEYCEVLGDRDKLSMVFAHAIRNAQDATPPDGRIDVHLYRRGGEVVVDICDTGCGMEASFIRERLFRPFDTTKGASGMGIGAYQVREYVESLGGRVEVDSAPGAGTQLKLCFPSGPGLVLPAWPDREGQTLGRHAEDATSIS
ncbi:MAG: PEP-CTERM system histidine kinase PrsK [Gammaproteobacteria bacterium]|nr:MAG: PEP-CTERM system histidine kinase PrsK [Gammaproteobacteria bacterium]